MHSAARFAPFRFITTPWEEILTLWAARQCCACCSMMVSLQTKRRCVFDTSSYSTRYCANVSFVALCAAAHFRIHSREKSYPELCMRPFSWSGAHSQASWCARRFARWRNTSAVSVARECCNCGFSLQQTPPPRQVDAISTRHVSDAMIASRFVPTNVIPCDSSPLLFPVPPHGYAPNRFFWLWMAGLRLGSAGKPPAGPPPTSPFSAGLRRRRLRNNPGKAPVAVAPTVAHRGRAALRKCSARQTCPRQGRSNLKKRRTRSGSAAALAAAVAGVATRTRNTIASNDKKIRAPTAVRAVTTLLRDCYQWS